MRNGFFSLLVVSLCMLAHTASAQDWWERETEMQKGGTLALDGKDWWQRAAKLEIGDQFVLRSSFASAGTMIVRKEARARRGEQGPMLVWILDDDGDMSGEDPKTDTDSDCYVVDYDCDGIVDRIVDYIDEDGDNDPDEMDIRYFVDGELRNTWFGVDLDDDTAMWDLMDYSYTGNFFESDPYGNSIIYMNKYDPTNDSWLPISECPFSFYDTDGDGQSEITVRFSGAPLEFSKENDPDYANSQARYQGKHDPSMSRMGVVNVRYSFDIDGMSSTENPLHYEMGFTMTGSQPYEFPGMRRNQPLRRHPKATVCIPHGLVREVADNYEASETGFTWREFPDASLRIGHPSRPDYDRRWEGVFWTWHRRVLHNTGGPVQDWNVRREYCPATTDRREIYFSPVDRRLHLKGAAEGWIQIGNIIAEKRLGEIRLFDSDEDGYFDRWEYYARDRVTPFRVAVVRDAQNVDFGDDWQRMSRYYTEEVLPGAIAQNQRLIAAIESLPDDFVPALPPDFSAALAMDISPDEKRYILDLIREFRYHYFQQAAREKAEAVLETLPSADPRFRHKIMTDSNKAWTLLADLSRTDSLCGRGLYEEAADKIRGLRELLVDE